jgi:hypothetical protein
MFGFGNEEESKQINSGGGAAAPKPGGSGDQAAGNGAANAEKEPKVGNMKPGDYMVHVHIQRAKGLKLDQEDAVDPFIKVKVLDQEKSTAAKEGISTKADTVFDEHIFLELKGLTKEQVEAAEVDVAVLNKGYFKGDTIGLAAIGVSKVYFTNKHVMKHRVFGINNPDAEDFSKITGFLTLSINVIGPGDEALELKMGSAEDAK